MSVNAYPYPELQKKQVLFLDVGINSENYFRWVNSRANYPVAQIDVITARSFPGDLSNFIHLQRKEIKLVFRQYANPSRGFQKLIFIVGAINECQYQVLEEFVDFFSTQWFELFGNTQGTSIYGKAFDRFNEVVENAFEEIPKNRLMKVMAHCKLCDQNYPIFIRKSLIEESTSYPVSLVFQHANHALLIYVDEKYHSRGESIVNITG